MLLSERHGVAPTSVVHGQLDTLAPVVRMQESLSVACGGVHSLYGFLADVDVRFGVYCFVFLQWFLWRANFYERLKANSVSLHRSRELHTDCHVIFDQGYQ